MATPTRLRRGCTYLLKLGMFTLVTFVLLINIVGAVSGYREAGNLLYPGRAVYRCETPADSGLLYNDVEILTQDGLTIRGWYVPGENSAAIVMAHGAHSNRGALWDQAQALHAHGYGVLLLDLRAQGASDGETVAGGWLDILAAVEYLKSQGVTRIGAYGFSLGTVMVIQAAALEPDILAIVADGTSPNRLSDSPAPNSLLSWLFMGYDLAYWTRLESLSAPHGGMGAVSMHDAVAQIAPRPMLLIAAGAEASQYEVRVAENLAQDQAHVEVWTIDDVRHGGGYAAHPDEFMQRVITFLDAALLP
jgi:uncharacterized protein